MARSLYCLYIYDSEEFLSDAELYLFMTVMPNWQIAFVSSYVSWWAHVLLFNIYLTLATSYLLFDHICTCRLFYLHDINCINLYKQCKKV